MRHLVLLFLFCVWFCFSNADIAFTWPVAGALLGSGDVTLWWKEDGDGLLIGEMASHLLVLYTGSNNVMTTLNEWAVPIGSNNITIHLDASLGPNATNSYFFGIQSNPINSSKYPSTSVPVLTNYSPRFSLTNMTGADFIPSIVAANAVCDSTDGPDSVIRMESEDQVSFNMRVVLSLSLAQITSSGAIGNPTHGAAVTNIPLTPSASFSATTTSAIPSTSTSAPTTPSATSTPTPTISPEPLPQTTTPAPSTQSAHKKVIIAIPVSLGVALLLGLLIFFYIRHRRKNPHPPSIKDKPSTTSSSSILPFFPPPPTHPNTWVDNSTLKNKRNHFWSRLKAKRPRRSVAELPGYENPSIQNSNPVSMPKFATNANANGNANRNTSTSSHTPILIPSTLPHQPPYPPPTSHLPPPPARQVGFTATGPFPTSSSRNPSPSPHPYPSKPLAQQPQPQPQPQPQQTPTIPTPAPRAAPRPKSQTYTSDEKTIQTATTARTDVSEIPSSTALSYEHMPMPPPPFEYVEGMNRQGQGQVQGYAQQMNGQGGLGPGRFRSPMARRDESAAVREAEWRIRELLGGGGGSIGSGEGGSGSVSGSGSGVVSPISDVSR
ncbi:Cell wall synthesis protein kre9 precursor [Clarireedia jacksonii]